MKNDNRNWEAAVRDVYGFKTVDDLQETWIESLHAPPQRVAKGKAGGGTTALASRTGDTEVRMSGLSAVPKLEAPIVHRGAAPDREERGRPAAKTASRTDDRPPPIALLLPPEYTPRK